MSLDAADVTSTIARLNASSFALDGLLKPLNLRTNCSAEARISVSVAGGSKLNSVLMLRHMTFSFRRMIKQLPEREVTAAPWPARQSGRRRNSHAANASTATTNSTAQTIIAALGTDATPNGPA